MSSSRQATSTPNQILSTSLTQSNNTALTAQELFELGEERRIGIKVLQNDELAFDFYQQAAAKGYTPAEYALGMCYKEGKGVEWSEETAIKWLTCAADKKYAPAAYELGIHYRHRSFKPEEQAAQQAIHYLQIAAAQEHADARYALAICYLYKTLTKQDKTAGIKLLQLAADQGHAHAQYQLALFYLHGTDDVERIPATATKYLQLAADQGHSGAQYELALCYLHGTGVEQNETTAVKLLQLANKNSDCPDSDVLYNLAACYEQGKGVTANKTEALDLYLLAARMDNTEAQYRLGVYYEQEEKDPTKAMYFYRLAATRDHTHAQDAIRGRLLSRMFGWLTDSNSDNQQYLHFDSQLHNTLLQGFTTFLAPEQAYRLGIKCEKTIRGSLTEATDFYQSAARQNHPGGQYQLGIHYMWGLGRERDYIKARELLELAARQGVTEAHAYAGECYLLKGNSTDEDKKKCAEHFLIGANHKDASAEYEMGKCYEKGYGVIADPKNAFTYYQRAAQHSYAEDKYTYVSAHTHLGLCYEQGKGVETNPVEAFKCYEAVAEKDDREALIKLGHFYESGYGCTADPKKAFECYEKAAKNHYDPELYNLGRCYELGIGCPMDLSKAFEYYQIAALTKSPYRKSKHLLKLALCYEHGTGCPVNETKAFKYYKEAVSCFGGPEAHYHLGRCYDNGTGTEVNKKKAFEYYESAAKQGHTLAQQELDALRTKSTAPAISPAGSSSSAPQTTTTANATTTTEQPQAATTQTQQVSSSSSQSTPSSSSAHSQAMDTIAVAVSMANSSQSSTATHVHGYSSSNHPVCSCGLVMSEHSTSAPVQTSANTATATQASVSANTAQASSAATSAIAQSNTQQTESTAPQLSTQSLAALSAQELFELGEKHRTGDGATQDDTLAARHYQAAALKEYAPAIYELGRCYDQGRGVPKSAEAAVKCFQQASDLNYAPAQCLLGDCYNYGHGNLTQNFDTAVALWTKAADEQRYAPAQTRLALYYLPRNPVKGFAYFIEAAENGHLDAQVIVCHAFRKGIHTQKNAKKASEYFEKIKEKLGSEELARQRIKGTRAFFQHGLALNCTECCACTNQLKSGDPITILSCWRVICQKCIAEWQEHGKICPHCMQKHQFVIGTVL